MPLAPIGRRTAPDEVYAQLLDGVLTGDLAAGEPIPSERDLAEVFAVSRPVVREALNRMASVGVIRIQHGARTYVRDYAQHGGLELLRHLLVRGGTIDPAVACSIVRARYQLAPVIAAEAARTITEGDVAKLRTRLVDITAAAADPLRTQMLLLDFWDAVVAATGSITYQLMFNTLRGAYEPALEALTPMLGAEIADVGALESIVEALASHDSDQAHRRVDAYLLPATETLTAALSALVDSM